MTELNTSAARAAYEAYGEGVNPFQLEDAIRAYLSAVRSSPAREQVTEAMPLTIANLQRAHIERQEEWCPEQKPDLSFRGNEMAGEVGEACNVIKKLERERHGWRGSRATKEQLAEELADVIHTAVLCAITAGIDIETATIAKFDATSEKNGLACRLSVLSPSPTGGEAGAVDEADGAMTPEEVHLENLKQMAAYEGPIVSLDVRDPYYLASCDHCGWIGSSEHCGADSWGDDSDVYCPRCHASGADCGKIAASITHLTPLMREVEAVLSRAHQKMRTYVSVYPGDKELRELLADWSTLLTKLQEDGR